MTELEKLEKFLKENKYHYKTTNQDAVYKRINGKYLLTEVDRHQITVTDGLGNYQWDAICQSGSYGFEEGLLEIFGNIVDEYKDKDVVVGWLTADDVIRRLLNERND